MCASEYRTPCSTIFYTLTFKYTRDYSHGQVGYRCVTRPHIILSSSHLPNVYLYDPATTIEARIFDAS